MKLKIAAIAVGALLLAAVPIVAHHSFSAEYDQSKPLTVKGKFTKMDWVNPHSWVHIEVIGADGKVTSWAGETPPPNGLYRNGWKRDSIKAGETIEMTGFAAKDGTPHMWASTVKLLDSGTTLGFNSRPPGEGPDKGK